MRHIILVSSLAEMTQATVLGATDLTCTSAPSNLLEQFWGPSVCEVQYYDVFAVSHTPVSVLSLLKEIGIYL